MEKLLSYKFKLPGLICIAGAAILTFFYFYYGMRIELPVFAVFSSYLETKIFATFRTNFSEELILLLYILGFSLIVFSEEKNEKHCLSSIRRKALNRTIFAFIFWMIFSVVFIYGNGFISILVVNIILPFFFYLSFFYGMKYRELKKHRLRMLQNKLVRTANKETIR